MTYRSAIDQPERFAKSKAVGAHFGLTPKKYQSGEIDRTGRISKVGDAMVRTALFEGGQRDSNPRSPPFNTQGLGVAGRQPAGHEEGQSGAGPQTGGGDAPHVV
jgi:transposase